MKWILLAALTLGGSPFVAGEMARPNIVLIMTDQHAAEAMSCRMGDRYLRTPALDGLAARGTLFSRAYAANPLCMPARNAMFTGRYPHQTGVTDNSAQREQRRLDPARFPTLGTHFQRAGYETAYFGKWHLCYDPEQPDTHGFGRLVEKGLDAAYADQAEAFLREKHDRPFLLVVSFLNPHNVCELARDEPLNNGPIGEPPAQPWLPPPPANQAAPWDEPDSMALLRRGFHASALFPVGDFTAVDWQELRWGYYRLIEKVDREVGRVLAAVEAGGWGGNTVVIYTSDHGECAGAHGFNQKTVFYEESARVPLVVRVPGQEAARETDRLVNVGVDLLPTCLDFAGLGGGADWPGLSLRPLAEGREPEGWRDHVVVQNHMSQAGLVEGSAPVTEGRMIRDERFKYCVYAHGDRRESLVDLEADPGEMVDLAGRAAYRDVVEAFRQRLAEFGRKEADPLVATLLADGVGARAFPFIPKPPNERARNRN